MSVTALALAFLVMGAGSCVQGMVGFGASLIAAPFLVLIDDRFVPGPITVASVGLNLVPIIAGRGGAVDRQVRWAIAGLVPGTVAGGVVLATLSTDVLSIAFACLVVLAVGLSLSGLEPRRTPRSLAAAGAASGVMGTVSGIGGPPIALVYQPEPAALLRATLPRFFLAGSLLSIIAISASGRLGAEEIRPSIVLAIAAQVGWLVSKPLVRHVDGRSARPVVLALSVGAAVAVVIREIAG
jgi:uncharacterized membrane protein YfcA